MANVFHVRQASICRMANVLKMVTFTINKQNKFRSVIQTVFHAQILPFLRALPADHTEETVLKCQFLVTVSAINPALIWETEYVTMKSSHSY